MSEIDIWRAIQEIQEEISRLKTPDALYRDSGTYAPTYLGGTTAGVTTYSLQAGFYTRVGRLITCWGAVVWTAATGTGVALISLPFAASSVANANFSGSVRVSSVTFANSTPLVQFAAGATAWQMNSPLTNAAGTNVAIEPAGNLIWTITYAVD